ncbi:hypothetical protein PUN71_021750, partial [Arthrobacter sp. NQ7]|uniref:hypothetical protein n=1 Tax=Arthrobacter sp. NQ7 TaxID=3032303 RepID=UPI00240FC603
LRGSELVGRSVVRDTESAEGKLHGHASSADFPNLDHFIHFLPAQSVSGPVQNVQLSSQSAADGSALALGLETHTVG